MYCYYDDLWEGYYFTFEGCLQQYPPDEEHPDGTFSRFHRTGDNTGITKVYKDEDCSEQIDEQWEHEVELYECGASDLYLSDLHLLETNGGNILKMNECVKSYSAIGNDCLYDKLVPLERGEIQPPTLVKLTMEGIISCENDDDDGYVEFLLPMQDFVECEVPTLDGIFPSYTYNPTLDSSSHQVTMGISIVSVPVLSYFLTM